jgi:hypothetical protein
LIHDLHRRIRELKEHHRDRLSEVLTALREGARTALQIAPNITWNIAFRCWDEFPPAQKWFAFGETLAHLRFLENEGRVRRESENDRISYFLT